jgi:uncharacterized protein
MELGDQRASDNVEDRRGISVGGGLGIGGIVIAIVAAFFGFDPGQVLQTVQQVQEARPQSAEQRGKEGAPADATGQFTAKVLGSTEDVWTEIFRASGGTYRKPKLVLYTGAVRSACGLGQAAMGPFYCPNDERVNIDLSFFDDLRTRFHSPGDFAEAYVVAHEVGHHVQKLLGTFQKLEAAQGRASKEQFNAISVRMELQADCYAGVWGYQAGKKKQLSAGDIEEALNAATAIGDDRLQKQSQGYVVPESFTHGSSAQRVRWFKRGIENGRPADCDTFSATSL